MKKKQPIEERLMFILKEISFNKYKLLTFYEQLKEEESKTTIEKTGILSWLTWKKPRNPKEELVKAIKKTTKEIKTLKMAHNDIFYGKFI